MKHSKFLALILSFVLVFTMLPLSAAFAASTTVTATGSCGNNLTWTLDSAGVLTISGKGKMGSFGMTTHGPWYSYADAIKTVIIEDGTTNIYQWAFRDCIAIESITIPDSVTIIEPEAFSGCTSLTNITIPDSVTSIGMTAFYGCTSLTNITIPDSVTNIDMGAFANCTSLTNVTIPDSITSIGAATFSGCTSLENIIIPEDVTNIGETAFFDCRSLKSITIPENVTSIGIAAFGACESLESITIPDSVTCIETVAFWNCTALTSVTIPENVKTIGDNPFYSCKSLTNITVDVNNENYCSVDGVLYNKDKTDLISYPAGKTDTFFDIPNGVTNISLAAFSVTNIESITLPPSVTNIADSVFANCKSLTSITIPDSVTNIGDAVFNGCEALTSITLPKNLTSIPENMFYACTSLASITIPNGVTNIGSQAFYDCEALNNIVIPDTVTDIEYYAFAFCDSLCNVIIPDSVVNIDEYAFYFCHGLKNTITIPDSVTNIAESAFGDCEFLTSITILNPDCEINDAEDTISYDTVIYGFAGSSAEAYAEKYNRSFEDITTHSYEARTTEPTCAGYGYTTYFCTDCDHSYIDSFVTGSGQHFFSDEWTVDKYPTLEQTGTEYRKCENCNFVEKRDIPVLELIVSDEENSGVQFNFSANTFDDAHGTATVEIKRDTQQSQYLLNDFSKVTAWNITFYSESGEEIQPQTAVTVRMPIPENYDINSLQLLHLDPQTNESSIVAFTVENGFVIFEATSFSVYVLIDTSTAVEDNTTDDSNEPTTPDCDHLCHKSGFMKFIWKIVQFFWKLFRMNPVCECGMTHY